jgi:hypothetical protein
MSDDAKQSSTCACIVEICKKRIKGCSRIELCVGDEEEEFFLKSIGFEAGTRGLILVCGFSWIISSRLPKTLGPS